jgi:hypothetical protein
LFYRFYRFSTKPKGKEVFMNIMRKASRALLAFVAVGMVASTPAVAQQQQKPNILFIMGDDMREACRSAVRGTDTLPVRDQLEDRKIDWA